MLAETSHAQIAATGSDAATPARVSHSTVRCCSATSVKRQRQAHKRDGRMVDVDDGVQRVVVRRGAVAPDQHFRPRARGLNLRAPAVVLHGRQRRAVLGGIAQHPAVVGDQRHPDARETAHPVGFLIELIGRQAGVAGEQLGGQARFGRQRRLDALHGEPADPRPARPARPSSPRHGPDDESGQEDLAAKPDRHGTGSVSLYPNCFTVVSASAISGSFSRRRRTWTSTVRVPPV